MTVYSSILSFAVVAGLLTIVPGLDTALVLRSAVSQGTRTAFATALGVSTGALIWGIGAAAGVSALLAASTFAYTCVRICGALYLIWMGVGLLAKVMRTKGIDPAGEPVPPVGRTAWRGWRRGLLTNLLNPKIGAFYVAVLPQFIPADTSHLLMGLILASVHDILAMIWFAGLILAAAHVRGWLSRRSVQRSVDGITGSVLIGFGARLGLSVR